MSFEGFPFNIGWELTLACNLRCNHCASSAGLPRPKELTTDEALRLCDQFPTLLVQEVDFTGGEPLLRKDWSDIATYLKHLGISINILTNGMALEPRVVHQMKEVGISNVGISLDGLEMTHDNIRGRKGSFRHVINSIEMMQKEYLSIIVITTVNDLNIAELPNILHLLQSIGIRQWRLQPLIPIGRARYFKDLEMDSQRILELGYFIRYWTPRAEKAGLQIICSDGLEYIDNKWITDRPWRGCPAGWVTCGITSDGKVKGCLSLPDEIVEGDLRTTDLWDIWFHPDAFAYTRRPLSNQLGSNCRSCDKSIECLGGCSSNSYAATKNFHNDPYCFYRLNKASNPCMTNNTESNVVQLQETTSLFGNSY